MARYPHDRILNLCRQLFFILLTSVSMGAFAGDNAFLPADSAYDESIPTPAATLGYEPGIWHVRHDQLVAYMQKLAGASDRIELTEIGKSYEDRTLLQLTISSPENLQRLEAIKAQHQRLVAADVSELDTSDLPVVVSLNYSIHGNEPSGSNAALLVAYHLAAAESDDVASLLDDIVIVFNPALNPDGLSLFATWVNYHKSKNLVAHPLSREHTAPWPAGRMNHYLFNLNRDWLFLQQRETQLFVQQAQNWLPHVFADFHETGTDTTAYFQPGVQTRIHPLTTKRNQALTARLAEFSAAAYDEQGLLYYTKERFDDFYHGKSSTYGDLIGSIGLTFEVGSSRGHLKESVNGPVDFALTIKKQIITSLALLEGAQQLREELLAYQSTYFDTARSDASRDRNELYIVGDDDDPGRLQELSTLLIRQGVDIFELARPVDIDGIEYMPGRAIAVPTQQNAYRIVKTFFERRTEFVEPVFYDISSWNAPMAFNLPVATSGNSRGLIGARIESPIQKTGFLTIDESKNGYAFSWQHLRSAWLLNRLLENGVHVRVATKPLSITTGQGTRSFARGSIIVPVQPQVDLQEPLHAIVQDAARESGVPVFSVRSGLAVDGVDLGSGSLRVVNTVKPLLLGGAGLSRNEVGEIWFLLDQRLDMPLPVVDIARFSDVKLADFTHLILVNGEHDALIEHVAAIQDWVKAGGTLVLQRNATVWAREHFIEQPAAGSTPLEESADPVAPATQRAYSQQEIDSRREVIAGAILHAEIDNSHPLGFGYDEKGVTVMRQGTQVLPFLANPYSHPGRYSDAPLRSGYVSTGNLEQIRNTPAISAEKFGEGLIVSFADNPNFRAYFFGSSKLFLNALFFSQAIDYID